MDRGGCDRVLIVGEANGCCHRPRAGFRALAGAGDFSLVLGPLLRGRGRGGGAGGGAPRGGCVERCLTEGWSNQRAPGARSLLRASRSAATRAATTTRGALSFRPFSLGMQRKWTRPK